MAKPKKKTHDIDDDPMFDTSEKARSNAVNRELVLLLERIERLREEKKSIADDEKDVFTEAKSRGFDTKTMRYILTLRKMDKSAREEMDALIETYRRECGI